MTTFVRQYWSKLWSNHAAFTFYMLLMAVLILSVYMDSGAKHLRVNMLYTFLLVFTYIFTNALFNKPFSRFANHFSFAGHWQKTEKILAGIIDAVVIIFPFLYFASAGYVPFIRMMYMDDYYAASGLRQVFFEDLPTIMNYGGEYFLRGLVPLWLVYAYLNKRRLFYVMLVITSLHALAIITKASIVILLFPLLVIQLARRDWRNVVVSAAAISIMLALNVTVLHRTVLDHLAKQAAEKSLLKKPKKKKEIIEDSAVTRYLESHLEHSERNKKIIEQYKSGEIVVQGIWTRLFAVQGKIVTQWLETFPDDKGFQQGCGYRWYAPLVPCQFVKLPDMVWMKYYKELYDEYKLVGTVSAPHYVNAYANFGDNGVLLSAIGMAILLVILNSIFINPVHNIAFNGSFLALALQTPLTSLMNSSGWVLMIVLYMAFIAREKRKTT
jgi:hypothetical protein